MKRKTCFAAAWSECWQIKHWLYITFMVKVLSGLVYVCMEHREEAGVM